MRITTYKLPGSDDVYTMGGDADDRVPPNAIDVKTEDGRMELPEQRPEVPTPAWGFPRIDGK